MRTLSTLPLLLIAATAASVPATAQNAAPTPATGTGKGRPITSTDVKNWNT
ncbi:MAG: hypothetical protein IT354_18240, partial [Gemmatimonadaceae bacterium]|nr:hypothetical protein [Gemmatimonadaceae bacterium]